MASGSSGGAPKYLSALFRAGTAAGLADRELLERFVARRGTDDEAAEIAFAALVGRHGPMVLSTCRAVLGDREQAEDAFQATFLVLANRARAIRRDGSVGAWLHGVALRVAACERSREARRRRHERRYAEMTAQNREGDGDGRGQSLDDLGGVLHEEIGRLPEKYRAAVVLCYLQGLTHDQAADRLGWPVGTVRRRLAWARDRLRMRLTRRGVASSIIPAGLSGPERAWEPVATAVSVPTGLAEATVRGALLVDSGKVALAGVVSAEAAVLMEGVLKTMMTKLTLLTIAAMVAGLVTAGAGMAAYSARGQADDQGLLPASAAVAAQEPSKGRATSPQGSTKPASRPLGAPSPEVRAKMQRRSEDSIHALLREYESESKADREAVQKAKTQEERIARVSQRRANPAAYAGALLYEAEMTPGTPAAEEALLWIVSNLAFGSMVETAKDLIARDHIRSDKIEALFTPRLVNQAGSKATERLFREALAKSPYKKIRGEACFYLARYLDTLAHAARLYKLYEPAQLEDLGSPIMKGRWGQDYPDRIRKLDPEIPEREAATLYERVVKDFGDEPLPHLQPNPTGDLLLPGRPTTFGVVAQAYLHELRDLGIGKPAPEIEGRDLDGKPMKLSDYRGKVVALYFCMPNQLQADGSNDPAQVTEYLRSVAERHANDAFALLGVSTASPSRKTDLESYKSLLKASGLPARFWWDLSRNSEPGLIQSAWNARLDLYLLDRHGVIRYKHVFQPELFEIALTTLLKEPDAEPGRPK